ncbi:MAG TPA: putative Ig domain-containing protein [Chitinophagales bacterium]|nr:putative Ig domain-containing protein [Chitinophagales bacterium]
MFRLIVAFAFVNLLAMETVSAQRGQWLYEGPPVFHGAKAIGNYPNTEFVFTVPATGQRPISFSAQGLPQGLSIDAATGIIRGVTKEAGEYKVTVTAANAIGKATEEIKIKVGDKLCLTPAMGWNSWNVFTKNIDEKMLMEMADAMVSNGMRDVGYQYINIDDFWHADSRDKDGNPVADAKKFPHGIKYVADYIHSKGLKLGIYSCAGNMTCGRRFGGYSYEDIDAKAYAAWGVDLLKYDYCYAPASRKAAIARYTAMGNALKKSGRSIVFSICEWGLRKPWLWAEQAGGNYWRTTPDIMDAWSFPSVFVYSMKSILNREEKLWKYAGPGHFNDPDMLTVGNYGKGNATSGGGLYKGMTDTEYETHFSLWCMFAAPLLSSCDLRSMNDVTYNILTNAEILGINQDELGEQARPVYKLDGVRVYVKHLADGSVAVAIFNASKKQRKFTLKPAMVDADASFHVRDVWEHADKGVLKDLPALPLKAHGTVVLKLSR